jgi:hypothetical protein
VVGSLKKGPTKVEFSFLPPLGIVFPHRAQNGKHFTNTAKIAVDD